MSTDEKACRVLFLPISGRKGASSRYRVFEIIPRLMDRGIACDVLEPRRVGSGLSRVFGRYMEHRAILGTASGYDVVYIQKRLFDSGFIARLAETGPRIVFDFDDSIFTSPKGDWSPATRLKVLRRLTAVMKAADMVVAGNGFLAGKAAGLGARRVETVPTAIDVSRYRAKEHSDREEITLGWIGSSVNHAYLDLLSGVFPRLAAMHRGTRLLVVSDADYHTDGIEVVNRRWSEQTEVEDLLEMDIGLMPLADDEWTRGKCALKALQYMAAGLPAVCSPVGANNEAVTGGVDGYLPASEDEWVENLSGLIVSSTLRADMGAMGREKVLARYEIGAVSGRLSDMLPVL